MWHGCARLVGMALVTPGLDAIELRIPTADDASVVGGWSESEAETLMWCSSQEHPVSADRVRSWWEPSDVEPYLAFGAGPAPVAYGELWLEPEEDEVELARLIVAPSLRGRGFGRALVAALVDRAAATGLRSVILRVNPSNEVALRCYRSSGFRELDAERNAEWNQGQPATYTWMELERSDPRTKPLVADD